MKYFWVVRFRYFVGGSASLHGLVKSIYFVYCFI